MIDPKSASVITTIQLGGSPEFAAVDKAAGRIYCNIEDKSEVAVIDTSKHEVIARWPLAPGEEPSGIALDAGHHRLFAGCHNKMMVMLDTESGKVVGSVPIGSGVDGCEFDDATQLAFASCGDGTTTIAREQAAQQIDSGSIFENRTRRENDGARPRNASDIFADRAVCAGAFAFAGRVTSASEHCSKHTQVARLRSDGITKRVEVRRFAIALSLACVARVAFGQGGPPIVSMGHELRSLISRPRLSSISV